LKFAEVSKKLNYNLKKYFFLKFFDYNRLHFLLYIEKLLLHL